MKWKNRLTLQLEYIIPIQSKVRNLRQYNLGRNWDQLLYMLKIEKALVNYKVSSSSSRQIAISKRRYN